jgi:molybdopterin synthase catalytic subunit
LIRVQQEDFDVSAELERLTAGNSAIGGLCVFVGLVRDFAGQQTVAGLSLEHYPGMTERQLAAIEEEARRRWPLAASLIVHRFGRLAPGDRIVLVAVAAAHRAPAFEACWFLIDWLKTKAPFWKAEETAAGRQWVEAEAGDEEAARRWSKESASNGG